MQEYASELVDIFFCNLPFEQVSQLLLIPSLCKQLVVVEIILHFVPSQ